MTATLPPKTGRDDHANSDIQKAAVVSATQTANDSQVCYDTQDALAVVGTQIPADQGLSDPQTPGAGGVPTPTRSQRAGETQAGFAAGGSPESTNDLTVANGESSTRVPTSLDLADPLLMLAADVLDDLERVRIANENRLRQLTRIGEDKDGGERGFGLTLDHPDVARLAGLVDLLKEAEKKASANLKFRVKRHPLGKWIAATKGVGEQQAARLLAAIGDPYWNDLHERPRLVSELWSYAGMGDASKQVRQRGVKANWSDDAKKRAWLIASKTVMVGGPYRLVYDDAKLKYADAVHTVECKRCGPKGKPAQPGSSLSDGHKHARALRIVAKSVLRDMWREAKRIHEGA